MELLESIEIRRMQKRDIPAVYEIECICFRSPWSKLSLLSELRNDVACYLVLTVDDRIVGYGGMWSGKWLAASLITGNSVMRDAVEQAQYRSGGEVTAAEGGVSATFGAVLSRNLGVLANPAAAILVLALLGLLVWLLVTKRCRFALERASLLSLAVAFAVPFVWYFLLRNHSLVHCWMTYRNLSAAVFALSGGLCFGLKGNGSPEN